MQYEFSGAVALLFILIVLFSAVWIFREYERGVVFFLGRLQKVSGPGFVLIMPGLQKGVASSH